MAISGSATSAYRVWLEGESMRAVPTTTLSTLCIKPEPALGMLASGETVTIAGSDMSELRRIWATWHAAQR